VEAAGERAAAAAAATAAGCGHRRAGEGVVVAGRGGSAVRRAAPGAGRRNLAAAGGAGDAGDGGDLTIQVQREAVERVAAALRTRFRYTLLVDLCAADDPRRDERFEVVYHLYSFRENRRIRLRVRTGPEQPVPSVSGIWRGAAWPEREAWDLFGIRFSGHPELTRLLLWEGFHGHPLRKDFPLAGIDTGAALHPDPDPDHLQPLPAPAAPPAAAVADEPA
jgi:NADH/F420H2 dehydrogenase subunit C